MEGNGEHLLRVPNTNEGRQFLAQLNKYMNREWFGYVARGRGKRKMLVDGKRVADSRGIRKKYSEWMAVYVHRTHLTELKSETCPKCGGSWKKETWNDRKYQRITVECTYCRHGVRNIEYRTKLEHPKGI